MADPIWSWTASETADAIRNGLISAVEAVESTLHRVDEVDQAVNALASVQADAALRTARALDANQRAGEELGPLHGVPVTTKINTDQAGLPTTDGVTAFHNRVATADAPHIENLRSAGAILLGRTNTPAFSIRWFTDNDLHGRTLNPWNADRTPGGSSGGAAAAVATGMGALAQGNDLGGSIRYPAAACGVVGLRPTPGRIPRWAGPADNDMTLGAQLMSVDGPIARTVADARLGFAAMATGHDRDPQSVPEPVAPGALGFRRVGVVRDIGVSPLDPAVDATITAAAQSLRHAGYQVQEVQLPLFEEAWRLWWLVAWGLDFYDLVPLIEEHGDGAIRKSARNHFAFIDSIHKDRSLIAYQRAYARRGTLMRELGTFLRDFSVLLLPVSAEQTFEIDADVASADRAEEVLRAQWPLMPPAFLGFPALSVPVTRVNGMPIGVQLLTRRFREDLLFSAGEVLEAHRSVFTPVTPTYLRSA